MAIRVFNTLSGEKEVFEPVNPPKVGIYLCGPTVYKPSHLGHAVGPIVFDAIKRYLVHRGYDVTWVVNITDVDDKIIDEARRQGCGIFELAERVADDYVRNMQKLRVTGIDIMPRASQHIQDIIDIVQRLIDRGAAYVVGGDVYFDISKDPDYGKLSHRRPEEQFAGTREGLVSAGKRNPGDFALWKAAKPDEPDEVKFDSPWGRGRPGWHIECSAMSTKYLGQPFDIHGGGMDLIFPHHENEIAQSETAYDKPFVKYWLHNGLTRINTKKLSKSDAEMRAILERLTLTRLLSEVPPELIRFFVLQTHYRRPIDFSNEALEAAKKALNSFYRFFERVERLSSSSPYVGGPKAEALTERLDDEQARKFLRRFLAAEQRFYDAMDDDFNTAAALAVLFDLVGMTNRFIDEHRLEASRQEQKVQAVQAAARAVVELGNLLGLFEEPPSQPAIGAEDQMVRRLIDLLVEVRSRARKSKQFEMADFIRSELAALGIKLEDRPDGTIWRMER